LSKTAWYFYIQVEKYDASLSMRLAMWKSRETHFRFPFLLSLSMRKHFMLKSVKILLLFEQDLRASVDVGVIVA